MSPLTSTESYHWRELPQVSFLSPQTRVYRDNTVFCRDKIFLSRQNFRRDKYLRVCRDKHTFVAPQAYVCRDEHTFVATSICRDKRFVAKNTFVVTKVLSLQAYFCRNKRLFCRYKHVFVATNTTNTCLLRQNVYRDKNNTYDSSRQ